LEKRGITLILKNKIVFTLTEKVAAITGGGSGIGRAISLLFAQQGAHVYILDADERSAEALVSEIKTKGGKADYLVCNVTDMKQVQETFETIVAKSGGLHVLVNNAGVASVGNLEAILPAEFERVFNVNVRGAYHCMHAAIGTIMRSGGGVILNMSSVAATVGISDRFAYSMSKGAVLSMTLSVAKDYIHQGIRCNCISPARVHTPFVDGFLAKNYPGREPEMYDKLSKSQPVGRMGTTEEVAALALYLCSDEAAFITGCDYPIDGGFLRLNN
jgi:2-keto-3-deoxy-L-fuconate dehydrogenase